MVIVGDDNLIDAENEFHIQSLEHKLKEMEKENAKYRILLKEADPDANVSDISDSEIICVEQLALLRTSSKKRELSTEEIKNLDILQKNLKIARGESIRVNARGKTKGRTTEDLESILKDK